jgi:hypothetical protein
MSEKQLTESRFGVYEGIIALAWADHELSDEEISELHRLIDGNQYMSDVQRSALKKMVDDKITLSQVWPKITKPQDRAFLINLADVIFHADGHYAASEQELYDQCMSSHMSTIDTEAVKRDLAHMAIQQRADRERLQEKMKAYAGEYSLIGRIKQIFDFN